MFLPVLTRTCVRAYPYLRPCLPVPAPVLTRTCAHTSRYAPFLSVVLC